MGFFVMMKSIMCLTKVIVYDNIVTRKGKDNKGLYELRIKFSSDIARIFYFTYHNNKFVLLHGFVKKTMKTPENEIKRARKYMEDYKRRSES